MNKNRIASGIASVVCALSITACAHEARPPQTVVQAPPPAPVHTARVAIAEPQMVEEWVQLPETITFEANRAVLTAEGESALQRLAEELRARDVIEVHVDGHVNAERQSERGRELSTERARVVMERLIASGFDADLFVTEGHGATQLVETDVEHRGERNRRVELSAKVRHEAGESSSSS